MKIYQFMKPTTLKAYQDGEPEDTISVAKESVVLIMSIQEFEKIKKCGGK